MKTFKITLFIALFIAVSSQTDMTPSKKEATTKEANTQKASQTEVDLFAHIVTGIRIPTQG